MNSKWFYYLYTNKDDGEYFCVQEHSEEAAEEILRTYNDDADNWELSQVFESDDAGDAYVDSLGLDVF